MMGDLRDTIVFPSVKERAQFLSEQSSDATTNRSIPVTPHTIVSPTHPTSSSQPQTATEWVKFGETKLDSTELKPNAISKPPCLPLKKPPPVPNKPTQLRSPPGKLPLHNHGKFPSTINSLISQSSNLSDNSIDSNSTNLDITDEVNSFKSSSPISPHSFPPIKPLNDTISHNLELDFGEVDPFGDDNKVESSPQTSIKKIPELRIVSEPNSFKGEVLERKTQSNPNTGSTPVSSKDPSNLSFHLGRSINNIPNFSSEPPGTTTKVSSNLFLKKPPLPPKSPSFDSAQLHNASKRSSISHPDPKKDLAKPLLPPKPVEKPSLPPKPPIQKDGHHARCRSESGLGTPPRLPVKPPPGDQPFSEPLIDSMNPSRLPPYLDFLPISIKGSVRCAAVCGRVLLAGDQSLHAWDISSGDQILDLGGGSDGHKISSVAFLPSRVIGDEGWYAWYASTEGQLNFLDIVNGKVADRRASLHNHTVIVLLRYRNTLLTFDESGTFHTWPERSDTGELLSSISFDRRPTTAKVPFTKGDLVTVVRDELWVGSHRSVAVYQVAPGAPRVSLQEIEFGDGVITCLTASDQLGWVVLGHQDGKISIWDATKRCRLGAVQLAPYRVTSLLIVLDRYLWVAVTNKLFVYDLIPPHRSVGSNLWVLRKEFIAHDDPITHLIADPVGLLATPYYSVVSISTHGQARFWDGLLSEDWQTKRLEVSQESYCHLRDIQIRVCSWNIDACKPTDLLNHPANSRFLEPWLCPESTSPDLIVVGFQETVDLESKKVTAKSIFRKKDETGEHITQRYNKWQQRLIKALHEDVSGTRYKMVECQNLVGLFTCIFIKESELSRINGLEVSTIKTGFGGLHGNKGAIAVRFTWDDTSLCFVNCHLAAGQTQISARNNDVITILRKTQLSTLQVASSSLARANRRRPSAFENAPLFVGGGDGQNILDHEVCIFSGDLNYRIDLPRHHIEELIEAKEWEILREHDQLYQLRRGKVPFMLRLFHEPPIQFAPTYKYDPYTDQYDTSDKRRSPAWCDRILLRGTSIDVTDYDRFECNVSDHRPIAATLICSIKTVLPDKYRKACQEATSAWASRSQTHVNNHLRSYLSRLGYPSHAIAAVNVEGVDPVQATHEVFNAAHKLPKLTYE